MKDYCKRLIHWIYFPLVILFVLMLVMHFLMNFSNDDINFFSSILDRMSWGEFLKWRYWSWTSRVVIEGVLVVLSRHLYLWRVLDSLIMVLLVYSLNRLLFLKATSKNLVLCSLITLLYPFWNMKEAGFCATTLNYLWVLAFLLFVLIPFSDIYNKRCVDKRLYPLYGLMLLYVCNQEQAVCIVLGVSLLFMIEMIRTKKMHFYVLFCLVISLGSLLFILTCPGNDNRAFLETLNWYPDYVNARFFDKVYLGIVSSMSILLGSIFVLWFFSFCLCASSLRISCSKFTKAIALGQFLLISGLSVYRGYCRLSSLSENLFHYSTDVGHVFTFSKENLLFLGLSLLLVIIFIYLLIAIFKKKGWILVFVLLFGCGTRLMMGFSPTIFASGARTSIFLYFSLLIIIGYLLKESFPLFKRRGKVITGIVLGGLAIGNLSLFLISL